VGPLTGVLEGINQGKELSIEDVEGAVKAALTFLGNASSQCTSLQRIGILLDYNKDLVSYGTVSAELFSSAMTTLLGPMFPEKATVHLQQMQTLRSACCSLPSKPKQGFRRPPCSTHSEGASCTIFRGVSIPIPGAEGAMGHQQQARNPSD